MFQQQYCSYHIQFDNRLLLVDAVKKKTHTKIHNKKQNNFYRCHNKNKAIGIVS